MYRPGTYMDNPNNDCVPKNSFLTTWCICHDSFGRWTYLILVDLMCCLLKHSPWLGTWLVWFVIGSPPKLRMYSCKHHWTNSVKSIVTNTAVMSILIFCLDLTQTNGMKKAVSLRIGCACHISLEFGSSWTESWEEKCRTILPISFRMNKSMEEYYDFLAYQAGQYSSLISCTSRSSTLVWPFLEAGISSKLFRRYICKNSIKACR